MLKVNNLSKAYGSRVLFHGVSFSLAPGERVGLLGRNGSGKSTLFRIILGQEAADEGEVVLPRGYQSGHLEQHLHFSEASVLHEACLGLPPDERSQEYRAEIILSGLGFSDADMRRPPAEFSGGFQIRINLAKLLLSEPNLLLLDEPTNYLDIVSLRWLTQFLAAWRGELIIISHDRGFLDSVITHSMIIHRGNVKKIAGGTSKLANQLAQDEEIHERTRVNLEKKRKDLETFINRFRAQASKASLVQSKIKMLEKMPTFEELADLPTLDFSFCELPFAGKQMVDVRNISFHYPDGPALIEDLTLTIRPGDRIGIVGKNGKGKSTLLRLLAGELHPNSGSVSMSQNVALGYFGQTNISKLSPGRTVEQEIERANETLHRTKVRAICGTMMFSGDDALKKIEVLSGGERSRVLLGKILAQPTNVLLLDEPTNHLDMESVEALLESLEEYKGAVVIVTHSEEILRRLASRLVIFDHEAPRVFNHEYQYFLEKEGWEEDEGMSRSQGVTLKGSNSAPKRQSLRGKDRRRLEREAKKAEQRVEELERDTEKLEQELLNLAQSGDIDTLQSLSDELQKRKAEIEGAFAEFERLASVLE